MKGILKSLAFITAKGITSVAEVLDEISHRLFTYAGEES